MGTVSIVFATAIGATEYPRAQLSSDAQRLATWANAAFGDRIAMTLTYALSGDAGRQMLLRILANFLAAIDAPALAYEQWFETAALARRRGGFTAKTTIVRALARSVIVLDEYDGAMVTAARATVLARRTGEVATEAAAQSVRNIAERRRDRLDVALGHQERTRALFEADSNGLGIGVAFLSSETARARVDRLLEIADDRLYQAKCCGRSRSVHEDPDFAAIGRASADA